MKPVFSELVQKGLELQFVTNCQNLEQSLLNKIFAACYAEININKFNQVLLIGNVGRTLWRELGASHFANDNPIDDYAKECVIEVLDSHLQVRDYHIVYPGPGYPPLQELGALAGWQSDSLLKIGIHPEYGTWFAYRALVLMDSDMPISDFDVPVSSCLSCKTKDCIAACPSGAVTTKAYDLGRCLDFRLQKDSICANQCLSRIMCPVGESYKYTMEQIHYHYQNSYLAILY